MSPRVAPVLSSIALFVLAWSSVAPASPGATVRPANPEFEASRRALGAAADGFFEPDLALVGAGAVVATAGDIDGDGYSDALIGAPNYDDPSDGFGTLGAVYVVRGSASGWSSGASQVLFGTAGSSFGQAVSSAGDVNGDGYFDVLVGAPGTGTGDGSAHVYLGSPAGLVEPPVWTEQFISPPLVISKYGKSVSTAGDVNGDGFDDIIVGVPGWSETSGAALVYLGNAGGVAQAPVWSYVAPSVGSSVSGAGDTNGDGYADVVVGIPGWDTGTGAAFVFHGNASGLSVAALGQIHGDQFNATLGFSVAGAGDVNGDGYADVIVGSPAYDAPGLANAGRVAVYAGGASGVTATVLWEEWGLAVDARFGELVATAGDVDGDGLADVMANAPVSTGTNGYAVLSQGSKYGMFVRWYRAGSNSTERFGAALGAAGDVDGDGFGDVLVGLPGFSGGQSGEGRVELYRGAADAPGTAIGWQILGGQPATFFGWVVTTAGDVNGDGYDDLLATAPAFDSSLPDDALVLVLYGSPFGPGGYGSWSAIGEQTGGSFGVSAACAGDVNGDGYEDIIIGAPNTGTGGRVYIWYGGQWGPAIGAANRIIDGPSAGAKFGASVASAGDVDGDGFADVIVGAPGASEVLAAEGRAFVYAGSPTGPGASPVWSTRGGQLDGGLGNSVACAGDVNGDGYSDVIVGMETYDKILNQFLSIVDVGLARVFHGSSTGLATAPAWTVVGSGNENLGHVVGGAGDVDGDGHSDVIVTSVYNDAVSDTGSAAVFLGSATGLSTTAHWSFNTGQAFANLGAGAACAGDVNRDGLSDVIVGAPFHDSLSRQDNGKAFVFAGPLTGTSATTPIWTFDGASSFENAGNAVGTAGDVNGDGFPDVVVGSPGYTSSFSGEGRVTVFYGNGGNAYAASDDGASRRVMQFDGSGMSHVAPLGLTSTDPHFMLRMDGGSPVGRGKVRLEWEVAPLGDLLDASLVSPAAWQDSHPGGAGVPAAQFATSSLAMPANVAHWRVRVASRSPHFPHSPWFTLARNGVQETDLRSAFGPTAAPIPVVVGRSFAIRVAPNPFNPQTTIALDLARAGRVQVQLYDVRGRLLTHLVDGTMPAGRTGVEWDGRDDRGNEVASGIYFARVSVDGEVQTAKLALVR